MERGDGPLPFRELERHGLEIHVSRREHDPAWDRFVACSPLGHFQQSGAWSEAKRGDGWQVVRAVIVEAASRTIVGGLQLLWKRKGLLRVGYVSKGPIISDPTRCTPENARSLVENLARRIGLAAVIVQPPDAEGEAWWNNAPATWMANRFLYVISATLLVSLEGTMASVAHGFSKSYRKDIRASQANGLEIRDATERDIDSFFALMRASCKRLGTTPNPRSPGEVKTIIDAFAREGSSGLPTDARLLMAEVAGIPLAGILLLCHGSRLTAWKMGWSGQRPDLSPTKGLVHAAMAWGLKTGRRVFDFGGIGPRTAVHLLEGGSVSTSGASGPDMFKLHFGGQPILLPESRIWLTSKPMRLAYRIRYGIRR